jgi:hypothetical protein
MGALKPWHVAVLIAVVLIAALTVAAVAGLILLARSARRRR